MKKLYKITTSTKDKNGDYVPNCNSYNVIAKTAEVALEKVNDVIRDNNEPECVDEIEILGVIDIE